MCFHDTVLVKYYKVTYYPIILAGNWVHCNQSQGIVAANFIFSHDELLLSLSLSTSQVSVSSLRLSSKLTVSLFLSLLSLTSSLLTLLL